jgi:hypothetical protein
MPIRLVIPSGILPIQFLFVYYFTLHRIWVIPAGRKDIAKLVVAYSFVWLTRVAVSQLL